MSSGILCSGSEACRSLDPKDRLCPRHNEGSRSWLFDPARLWKAGPARNPNPRQAERRLRAWLRPPPLVLFRPDPPAWLRPHIHREIPGDRSLPPTPNPETPSSAAQKSDAQFRLAKSKTPRRPSHGLSMRNPPHLPRSNIPCKYSELLSHAQVLRDVVEEAVLADELAIDFIGVGEHHRADFAISAPEVLLAAIAGRTRRIRLGSAVTVLSSDDPIRVFQRFATLNAVSNGRAEVILGRGSFTESFPLFGFELSRYEELFEDKLDLFAALLRQEPVTWKGRTRPPLT